MFFEEDDDRPRGNTTLHTANENTFLSWSRTIIALLAFGLVLGEFAVFMDEAGGENRIGSYLSSIVILTTATVALGFAVLSYQRRHRAIEHGDRMRRRARGLYIYAALIGLTALALALMLIDDVRQRPPDLPAPAQGSKI